MNSSTISVNQIHHIFVGKKIEKKKDEKTSFFTTKLRMLNTNFDIF
jgi:hypothetical protein